MRSGIIYSFILHICIAVIIIFGMPRLFKSTPPKETILSVDILPITAVSNIKSKNKHEEEKKPQEEAKKIVKSSKSEDEPSKEEKKEEKKEDNKSEPVPQKDSEKKEPIKEEKKKEAKKEKKKEDKKPKEEKKKEEKPKKKNKDEDLDSLLKTLETPTKKEKKESKKEKDTSLDEDLENALGEFDESKPLSISEEDAIRSQVSKWWSLPAGAKEAGSLSVVLKISFDKDGSVTNVELVEANVGRSNETFKKAFVDSAIRAVRRASPLKNLPVEKYSSWKQIELNFDPKEMLE